MVQRTSPGLHRPTFTTTRPGHQTSHGKNSFQDTVKSQHKDASNEVYLHVFASLLYIYVRTALGICNLSSHIHTSSPFLSFIYASRCVYILPTHREATIQRRLGKPLTSKDKRNAMQKANFIFIILTPSSLIQQLFSAKA
jgi:hypothetical protein